MGLTISDDSAQQVEKEGTTAPPSDADAIATQVETAAESMDVDTTEEPAHASDAPKDVPPSTDTVQPMATQDTANAEPTTGDRDERPGSSHAETEVVASEEQSGQVEMREGAVAIESKELEVVAAEEEPEAVEDTEVVEVDELEVIETDEVAVIEADEDGVVEAEQLEVVAAEETVEVAAEERSQTASTDWPEIEQSQIDAISGGIDQATASTGDTQFDHPAPAVTELGITPADDTRDAAPADDVKMAEDIEENSKQSEDDIVPATVTTSALAPVAEATQHDDNQQVDRAAEVEETPVSVGASNDAAEDETVDLKEAPSVEAIQAEDAATVAAGFSSAAEGGDHSAVDKHEAAPLGEDSSAIEADEEAEQPEIIEDIDEEEQVDVVEESTEQREAEVGKAEGKDTVQSEDVLEQDEATEKVETDKEAEDVEPVEDVEQAGTAEQIADAEKAEDVELGEDVEPVEDVAIAKPAADVESQEVVEQEDVEPEEVVEQEEEAEEVEETEPVGAVEQTESAAADLTAPSADGPASLPSEDFIPVAPSWQVGAAPESDASTSKPPKLGDAFDEDDDTFAKLGSQLTADNETLLSPVKLDKGKGKQPSSSSLPGSDSDEEDADAASPAVEPLPLAPVTCLVPHHHHRGDHEPHAEPAAPAATPSSRTRRQSAANIEPPVTRSKCTYEKLKVTEDDLSVTMVVPRCAIDHSKLKEENAVILGPASEAEQNYSQVQLVPRLNPILSTKVSRIIGAVLERVGHCSVLSTEGEAIEEERTSRGHSLRRSLPARTPDPATPRISSAHLTPSSATSRRPRRSTSPLKPSSLGESSSKTPQRKAGEASPRSPRRQTETPSPRITRSMKADAEGDISIASDLPDITEEKEDTAMDVDATDNEADDEFPPALSTRQRKRKLENEAAETDDVATSPRGKRRAVEEPKRSWTSWLFRR